MSKTKREEESGLSGPSNPSYGADNKIFTRKMAARAREKLQSTLAGFDPEDEPEEREKRIRFLRSLTQGTP